MGSEAGVPSALRRLARLGVIDDVEYDPFCEDGGYHGKVKAQVGSRLLSFEAHHSPSLGHLLDRLADAIEHERRLVRQRRAN